MDTKYKIAIIAVIVVFAIAAVILIPKNQQGNSSPPTIQENYAQNTFCLNAVTNQSAMQFAIQSGVTCFRTDINFNQTQINRMQNESQEGVQYLGILDYETVGAQPAPGGCSSGCNWTLADWNVSVAKAVADYPSIHTWEIWNEPLVPIFTDGYENSSPLNYFNMIKAASTIIKAKDPNATIVCFGGAQIYPFSSVQVEYPFDRQVWSYGASKYCDAISLHVYSLPFYSLNQTFQSNATLVDEYNYTISLYENLTGKPIWITETGISSNNWTAGLNLSEQKQASFLNQDLSFLSSYSFVKRIYWFNLLGSSTGADYGLLNYSTLKPKPAWYQFIKFVNESRS